jgi:hypothetical protein
LPITLKQSIVLEEQRMNYLPRYVYFFGLSLAALLASSACKVGDQGEASVNVADGSLLAGKEFAATYYCEFQSSIKGRTSFKVGNVGTLLDIGLPAHKVLILSLADAMVFSDAPAGTPASYLPVADQVDIKLFTDKAKSGSPALELTGLQFQRNGQLMDQSRTTYSMVMVGATTERISNQWIARMMEGQVQSVSSRMVFPGDLLQKGYNLRNIATSFALIAIPNTKLGGLPATKAVPAKARPNDQTLAQGEMKIVGFGDLTVRSEAGVVVKKNDIRNAARVSPLNLDSTGYTSLRKFLDGNSDVLSQIWEVKGSGVCGAAGEHNYDTGAGIYYRPASGSKDWAFLGFVPRSSSTSSQLIGPLDCTKTPADQMASVVVSPTQEHFDAIKILIGN